MQTTASGGKSGKSGKAGKGGGRLTFCEMTDVHSSQYRFVLPQVSIPQILFDVCVLLESELAGSFAFYNKPPFSFDPNAAQVGISPSSDPGIQACQAAGIVHGVQKLDNSRMSVHCTMLAHTLPTKAYSILTTTVSGVALG